MSTNDRDKQGSHPDPVHGALLAAIVIPYGLCRVVGLAQSTAMLSGTVPDAGSMSLGALYVILHLLACVVAPCLAVAAMLDGLLVLRRSRLRADSIDTQK